jgi:DNA-binding NarL/FixJ family response regulator
MERIRVTLVNKRTFFRGGLRASMKVLECQPNQLMSVIDTQSPDVILLDTSYPSISGLELCRRIVRRFPRTSVIMLIANPTYEGLLEVLKSGAAGCLNRAATVEEMARIIKQACLGKHPIVDIFTTSPLIPYEGLRRSRKVMLAEEASPLVGNHLTPQEVRILNCIAGGNTNKEIGHILGISEQTVKNHVSSIFQKLNASDRAHATALAILGGFITGGGDLLALHQTEPSYSRTAAAMQ